MYSLTWIVPLILVFLAVACFAHRQKSLVSRNLEIDRELSDVMTTCRGRHQSRQRGEMDLSFWRSRRLLLGNEWVAWVEEETEVWPVLVHANRESTDPRDAPMCPSLGNRWDKVMCMGWRQAWKKVTQWETWSKIPLWSWAPGSHESMGRVLGGAWWLNKSIKEHLIEALHNPWLGSCLQSF